MCPIRGEKTLEIPANHGLVELIGVSRAEGPFSMEASRY
jgi:hypothetical protein